MRCIVTHRAALPRHRSELVHPEVDFGEVRVVTVNPVDIGVERRPAFDHPANLFGAGRVQVPQVFRWIISPVDQHRVPVVCIARIGDEHQRSADAETTGERKPVLTVLVRMAQSLQLPSEPANALLWVPLCIDELCHGRKCKAQAAFFAANFLRWPLLCFPIFPDAQRAFVAAPIRALAAALMVRFFPGFLPSRTRPF